MNPKNCGVHSDQPCSSGLFYDLTTTMTYYTTNITTTTLAATTITSTTKKPPLLSYETKVILEYIIHIGMFYTTAFFGIVVNIINIIVYKKQGLRDSITIGLFALSVSDLFVSGLPIETATCYALKFLLPDSNIHFVSVHYVHSSWSRRMFYSLSCSITAMLCLERCCCVIFPFKVRMIFTKTRTATIIVCLVLIHVASFVPIFATHRLRWVDDPSPTLQNSSSTSSFSSSRYLRLWFAPNRDTIESFNSTFMAIVTPTVAQAIVTCCVMVMIHGLRKASKFRQAVTSTSTTSKTQTVDEKTNNEEDSSKQTSTTLSPRDARLVRTMVFIVGILSACNIPYLMMTYAILLIHDLNMQRPYHNTYSLIFSINYVLSSLNASLNVFIYYNTSTRYREVFKQTFSACSCTPDDARKEKE